jgi:hypothetical protein
MRLVDRMTRWLTGDKRPSSNPNWVFIGSSLVDDLNCRALTLNPDWLRIALILLKFPEDCKFPWHHVVPFLRMWDLLRSQVFVRKPQLWVITHHGHIASSALIAPDGILMKTYLTPKQMWTDTRQHNKALKISTESFFFNWNISDLFPIKCRLLHYFIFFRS